MGTEIGNYFFPQFLYRKAEPSVEAFASYLAAEPLMDFNAKKFAPVASILNDSSLPIESRTCHVDFFYNSEVPLIANTAIRVASVLLFEQRLPENYVQPTGELMQSYHAMNEEILLKASQRNAAAKADAPIIATGTTNSAINTDQSAFAKQLGVALSDSGVKIPAGALDDSFGPPLKASNSRTWNILVFAIGAVFLVGLAAMWMYRNSWGFARNGMSK